MLIQVPASCLIFTLNEEINLPFCLRSLDWCDDVVVVDSFSRDATEAIARAAGARFVQHAFTGFGDQRNWALEQVKLKHPWALILDADERVSPEMVEEMSDRLASAPQDVAAFRLRRRFHLWGRWLRYSALYPTWVVRLVRVGRVRFINRGHAETQEVDGRIDWLRQDLIDENHKGLDEWRRRQERYARMEAHHESLQPALPWRHLWAKDPLLRRAALKSVARRLPGRPFVYFLYAYFFRFGFLDGISGLRFCIMKAQVQQMIVREKRLLRSGWRRDRTRNARHPVGSKPTPDQEATR